MNNTHSLMRYKLAVGFLFTGIALMAVLVGFSTTAHAQTCGATWETTYTIEPNPFPPGSPAAGAWSAVYGESRIIESSYQVARPGDEPCGGDPLETPTALLQAVPDTITAGEQSALSWSSLYATSCTGTGFSTGGAVSGTVLVSPGSTTNYSVSCTDGVQTAVANETITVSAVATSVTASLTATPGTVASGGAATLTWSSTNALSCIGTGFDTAGATSGTVSTGPLTESYNFSITCTGAGGTGTGATWQYYDSDISDFACPLTDPNRAYGGVPTCPVNPAGTSCTGSPSFCKVNTINGCSINTNIYNCVGGTVTPAPTASASAFVTVTPAVCVDATVQPGVWYNATQTLLWSEQGENSANGGGLNNNEISNAYQAQCLAECPTGKCNYRFNNDLGSLATSQTSFTCYSVPSDSVTAPKPITTSGNVETMYSALTVPASCTVNVADLSAGGITPTSATVNTAVNLLATISNIGSAHSDAFRDAAVEAEGRLVGYGRDVSGDGLPVLFQIDADTDHNSGITVKTVGIAGIAGGGTRNATVAHIFSTAGTWYVRSCADAWADMTGIVNESNELNNCGPWTAITVTSGGGAVTSCSASPLSITTGGSTTWTALPAGLASYTFTPSETGTGVVRATNTYARTYSTAGSYGMSVTAGGATVACSNTVTVGNPSCGTATPTITAVPDRVTSGGTSVITVSATGVDGTCTVTGPGVNQTITATSCGVPSTNITTGPLSGQSTFTISCDGGETTAKAVVNVTTNWSIF